MTLALSIRQPWASLILFAGKDIENRNWSTATRGPCQLDPLACDCWLGKEWEVKA
jgi:hypothetical protein